MHHEEPFQPGQLGIQHTAEAGAVRAAPGITGCQLHPPRDKSDVSLADHIITPQHWQSVVAEPTLRRGRVGLDPVGPVSRVPEPAPVPDQQVARRQQADDPGRGLILPCGVRRRPEIGFALDLAPLQFSIPECCGDYRARGPRPGLCRA